MKSSTPSEVAVRRVYEPPESSDGHRILVDRLWPRGLSKAEADKTIEEWCRDVAPSTELRKWYGHDPDRFADFRDRYRAELTDADHAEALKHLRDLSGSGLTLLTATKDLDLSAAKLLADQLNAKGRRRTK